MGDGLTVAASELATLGIATAGLLADHGLEVGDRVGLWMRNGLAYLQALAACAAAGFVAVSINTRATEEEVANLLERSGARMLVTDRDWQQSTTRDRSMAVVVLRDKALPTQHTDAVSLVLPGSQVSGRTRFVLFTTSGTTSLPKMVVHAQSSIADHAHDIAKSGVYSNKDVALVPMPLCGTFGLTSLMAAVASNCERVIVPRRFQADETAALIETHGVTVLNGSDDMFHRLLATVADLSSIRLGGYARFNTSLDGIVARADERGMTLTGLYGMSEVQALFTIRDRASDAETRGKAGGTILSAQAQARVIDDELELRGPSLFEGYLEEGGNTIDTKLTAAAFDEGWFRTGDSAEQTGASSREFTFLARLGDVLRLGGFLVAPTEIEQVILEVEGVREAQVVAVDRPSGARPVAFVLRSAGEHAVHDEDLIRSHCQRRLARFKVPIRVFVLKQFPTVTGPNGVKILRNELRQMATTLVGESPGPDRPDRMS